MVWCWFGLRTTGNQLCTAIRIRFDVGVVWLLCWPPTPGMDGSPFMKAMGRYGSLDSGGFKTGFHVWSGDKRTVQAIVQETPVPDTEYFVCNAIWQGGNLPSLWLVGQSLSVVRSVGFIVRMTLSCCAIVQLLLFRDVAANWDPARDYIVTAKDTARKDDGEPVCEGNKRVCFQLA